MVLETYRHAFVNILCIVKVRFGYPVQISIINSVRTSKTKQYYMISELPQKILFGNSRLFVLVYYCAYRVFFYASIFCSFFYILLKEFI